MLDEGAGGKDALALADAIDFLGAQIGTEASWDAVEAPLRALGLGPLRALTVDEVMGPAPQLGSN
jgi:hypothetical protein